MTISNSSPQTILFLAASPKSTAPLRLDQELRDIAEGLRRAQKRDQFNLEQRSAVRPRDIQRAMLDLEPQIIHFSGHGAGEAGLVFEDEIGNAKLFDGNALADLFKLFADQLNCVLLNGCYSEVQANAIAQHIPYVIGMNKAIGDQAAIAFAVGFYDALGAGRSVEFAFKLGCAAIRMEGIIEHLTPVLIKKPVAFGNEVQVNLIPQVIDPISTALPTIKVTLEKHNNVSEITYIPKESESPNVNRLKMNRRGCIIGLAAGVFTTIQAVNNFFKAGIFNAFQNKSIDPSSIHLFEFKVIRLDVHGVVEQQYKGTAKKITEELSNGIDLEVVKIPGGEFLMGSRESDKSSIDNERPIHKVNIGNIYMGRYPITQEQYKALMGNNPSHFKGEKLPVEHVSRENAQTFCRKLSQQSKRKYRLPSEAEWEYACRAGSKTPFYFGEVISDKVVNYNKSNSKTSVVGIFPANNFGLQDMHGNVWEWCEDNWHEDYNEAPTNGRAWHNEKNNVQILRGGSWDYGFEYCRSAFRGTHYLGNSHGYNGFRVVLEVS
jgi:formylglycine-generating enzyme required for sulfatase activity